MNTPSNRELDELMSEIVRKSLEVGYSQSLLPKTTDDNGYMCTWIEIDWPLPIYRLKYRERDNVDIVFQSADRQAFIEYVLS